MNYLIERDGTSHAVNLHSIACRIIFDKSLEDCMKEGIVRTHLHLSVMGVESGQELSVAQRQSVEKILRNENVHTLVVETGKDSYVKEVFPRRIRTLRRA